MSFMTRDPQLLAGGMPEAPGGVTVSPFNQPSTDLNLWFMSRGEENVCSNNPEIECIRSSDCDGQGLDGPPASGVCLPRPSVIGGSGQGVGVLYDGIVVGGLAAIGLVEIIAIILVAAVASYALTYSILNYADAYCAGAAGAAGGAASAEMCANMAICMAAAEYGIDDDTITEVIHRLEIENWFTYNDECLLQLPPCAAYCAVKCAAKNFAYPNYQWCLNACYRYDAACAAARAACKSI
jgi:hypothetical protein